MNNRFDTLILNDILNRYKNDIKNLPIFKDNGIEIIDECTELNNTSTKDSKKEAIEIYENLMKQGFEKHKLNRHFPNGCLI